MEKRSVSDCSFNSSGKIAILVVIITLFLSLSGHAINSLTRSQFTEIVNQVNVLKLNSPQKKPQIGDIFQVPELLQTGSKSRAELIAEDQTVTRVGANTLFAFSSQSRTLRLQRGSLLFHSPKGQGGGTIQTASAAAAVLGTTLIVTTTDNGGFKCLLLEGRGEVRLPNGFRQILKAGELVFITPGSQKISKPLLYDLKEQIENSSLVQGFSRPLLSLEKIQQAIDAQQKSFPQLNASSFLVGTWKQNKELAPLDANSLVHLQEANLKIREETNIKERPRPLSSPGQNPPRPRPPIPG